MSPRLVLRSGAFAAFAAAFLLVWQFVIALNIGDEIALLSRSVDPARLTSFFQIDARAVTQLMTADDGFAIAYGIAFVAFGFHLLPRARSIALPALVLALATALTDLAENSLTLASVQQVVQNQPLEASSPVMLFWLGQMKYLLIYVASLLFAIGVWETGKMGKVLAVLFLLFPLIGLASIAVEELALVKVFWMFVLLIAGGVYLVMEARRKDEG